ncbi:MAG: PDZ domain-containing protein [Thermoanaerobaculia bacterium]|jgi:tricorn protease
MKRLAALATMLFTTTLAAAGEHTLYQEPTMSRTAIVFAYAGDLWSVARAGGTAVRLTTSPGVERTPRFSPDGSTIAFSGEYDGNVDVFVIPAAGGVPKRLTFHPGADAVVGWTSDGTRVLFHSSRESSAGYDRLFTVGLDGGLAEALPLPQAFEGSFSPDGTRIAYQPITKWQPDWKRAHGGQNGRIWIARLSDSSVEKMSWDGSNDVRPIWMGDSVYFISDRNSATGARSIFAWSPVTKQIRQVMKNDGLDVKSMSAGPDAIVYEQFGTIFVLDPATAVSKKVDIRVDGDFPGVRPRFVSVGDSLRSPRISPTGARAVFAARGEIVTVPAEKGDPRNLTNSPGVMERTPAWSPDGKWLAYFSDESGEYALHLRDQKGSGEVRKIVASDPPSFYFDPVWSPDSRKIAYADRRLNLWYVDVDKRTPVKVDTSEVGFTEAALEPAWSPDSQWIAWSKRTPNLMRAVFVHSIATGKTQQLTDGMSDVAFPVFDKSGKYLFVAASTDIGRGLSWADLSGIDSVSTRAVYGVVLRNDLPSPLAPESDEEKGDEKKKGDDKDKAEESKKKGGDKEKADEKKPEPVRIDFDGIGQRIVALPIAAANVRSIAVGKEGILFVAVTPPNHFGSDAESFDLRRFNLEKRKDESFLSGIKNFDISANGEKVLFRKGKKWTIASTDGEPKGDDGTLATDAVEVRVDPPAEWREMFRDAWLAERDHFYDPNHHGLDIEAAKRLYAPYLDAVAHRADLTYLFREMLNQLTIGHLFVGGGDIPEVDKVKGGLLGCDFAIENARYRFKRVFDGENWDPELRAPLTAPGVSVKTGDYLLAVNGRDLAASANVYAAFENTADKQVTIRVGPTADGKGARDVTVVPVDDEEALRHRAWIEGNRRKVNELSGGKLAYIYIPNTGNEGYTSFNRYFFSQTDKQGAVVDERNNQGGLLADYVVDYLTRPQLSAITFRYATRDVRVPAGAIYGPKAMLINGMAGSGGDAMPWYFRKMKVGPLIGTRTWGGLVAANRGPTLMDGGYYTAPDAAVYGLDGKWDVENAGVPPDIEVELDPAAWRAGHDTQLERAVQYLLDELVKNPRTEPVRPPYPTYDRCCGLNGQ